MYYGGKSMGVLWWNVSECIMVESQWVYYGRMSVSVLWWDVSECIIVGLSVGVIVSEFK